MKRIRQYAATFVSSLLALALALATVPTGALAIEAFAEEAEETEEIEETGETEGESSGTTVCTVNGTAYYGTLQEAIDAAESGDVIQLTSSVELDSTLDISKTITLRLMGYTISASESFDSGSSASLIYVHDTSSSVGIIGGTISGSCTNLIKIIHATLSLTGVTLDGNSSAEKGIYVYGTGALVYVANSTIRNVKYGIYAYKCNPSGNTTSGIGSISSSTINASYVGIWLYMSMCPSISSVTITGGTHGVVVMSNCGDGGYRTEMSITGSTITGTSSYAIYVADSSWYGTGTLKLSLTNCTLSGADDVAVYAHSYMATPLGENYSVSVSGTNIVCSQVVNWNWTAYYTTHDYVLIEAVEPTCTESGMAAYYTCSRCGPGFGDAEDEEHSGKPDDEDDVDPENPNENGSHGGSGDDQEGEDLPGEGNEPEGGSTPEFNSDHSGRWIEIGGFVYYYEEDDAEEESSGGTIGSGALALVNVDAETGAYLDGATYALFRSSNNDLVGVYTADERGWISTYALSYDTYYFVQVEAAEGYVLDQTAIYVTLTKTLSYSPEYPWVIKAESAAADAAAVVEAGDAEMTEAEETAE